MSKTLLYGQKIMLFNNDTKKELLACSTSATFNISTETTDVSNKDFGNYGGSIPTKLTYEISTDGLVFDDSAEDGYTYLFDKMASLEKISVIWGKVGNFDSSGNKNGTDSATTEVWTLDEDTRYYKMDCYVTSLNLNANNGELSTYSLTLTGASPIVPVDKAS